MVATTALTAQDTTAVYDIHHVPSEFVAKQIDICLKDIGTDAVKIGMLASEKTTKAVAETLKSHDVKNIVLDPVRHSPVHRRFRIFLNSPYCLSGCLIRIFLGHDLHQR